MSLSRFLSAPARQSFRALANAVLAPYIAPFRRFANVDAGTQLLLALKYREMQHQGVPLPALEEVGFRAYSQTDEDGILLYLFTILGTTNKKVVELCVEQGIECNAANLIINHGWIGLLFDGDARNIRAGRRFYARCRDTWIHPPQLVCAWIEAETVNTVIAEHGFTGEIDLLSIDIDGMDYWVWEAINGITPRVVVVEYHDGFGPDQTVASAYDKEFNRHGGPSQQAGASLAAFVKLGRRKGYRLVGCNRFTFNAFFVRSDIGPEIIPESTVEKCLSLSRHRHGQPSTPQPVVPTGWVEV